MNTILPNGMYTIILFQALDQTSKPLVVMNGKIPNNSAHAAGLRISTNNPNVFFRETSFRAEKITAIQAMSSLERERYHRNNNSKKNKNMSNDNKKRKRNGNNIDRKETEARDRYYANASRNVTTESTIVNSNAVSMDTRNGGNGMVTKGHIAVLPHAEGRPAGSASVKNEGGCRWGKSQLSCSFYVSIICTLADLHWQMPGPVQIL